MSRFTRKINIAVLKTMEALGTSAANLASNAKLKVNELTLETRRREILTDFSLQAFELWQKGVSLPDPLAGMLTELSDIESRLSVLRAQKYAKLNELKTMNTNRGSRHFIYLNRTFFGLYNMMHDLKAKNIEINHYKKFIL